MYQNPLWRVGRTFPETHHSSADWYDQNIIPPTLLKRFLVHHIYKRSWPNFFLVWANLTKIWPLPTYNSAPLARGQSSNIYTRLYFDSFLWVQLAMRFGLRRMQAEWLGKRRSRTPGETADCAWAYIVECHILKRAWSYGGTYRHRGPCPLAFGVI